MTFIGQMDDGAEYATDGSRVYQLVPGKDRKRAVSIEPEREARVRSMMAARRAEAAGTDPAEAPERSVMGDMGRLTMSGGAKFVGDIGRVVGSETAEQLGDRGAEYWREGVSPETQAEMQKPFLDDDGGIGPGLTSPTKVAGTIAESVLPMGAGMAGGASLARAGIAAGASPAAAGFVGGAVGEGTVAGVMSAGQVSSLIDQIPEEKIALAEPYQQAYHSLPGTMDDRARRKQAREMVKRQAMGDVGPLVALATAAFGAPSGMAIGRIIGGETGKSLLSTMVKQGLLEGVVQEAPQSASEQALQNRAIQQNADPTQPLDAGIGEAAVGGAVAGTAMGAAMGPVAHASARDEQPPAPPAAPRAAAPPAPPRIAGMLPSPTMVVDSQGNAEMASARDQRLQDAERRAREAEQAGDMETALRIRQEALALLQGEDVPPEPPAPPAAPLALPAPSAPPIITDAQGNAETTAQREARMVDTERRARAAEQAGDMETAIRLRRELHAPQLAPQAPPETLGGYGIDASFVDPEALDLAGAPEETGLGELDAALRELDALVGEAPRRAPPAPTADGITVGKAGPLERVELAPPPAGESAPFDPGAPRAGGTSSAAFDVEQIDAAPPPQPQRALPPPTMVVDREGVAQPLSAMDAQRRERIARSEQQAADMERRANELERGGDAEQAMYLRKLAAGYADELTERARAEASRNGRLPEGLKDPRLARDFYRRHLEGMAGELMKGQNRNVEVNADGDIARRLPSQNPQWFQSMGMTVAQVQHAVKKALAGGNLGKREAAAVAGMLDEIRARRVSDDEMAYARERRAAARAVRVEAAKGLPPIYAYEDDAARAGDLYEEADYDPNWDGETRALFELYQDAAGIDQGAADAILESGMDDSAAARRFAEIIHGRETGQGAQESGREQGGRASAEAQEEPESDTQEVVGGDPLLESYSADDLKKRADADKAAEKAKAEGEAKVAADDARGSFALTGSDREADEAAARGQNGLFDQPADQTGASPEETAEIADAFDEAKERSEDGDRQVHHLFDPPAAKEVVRLQDKVKVYVADKGWMTPAEAKAEIAKWKAHAAAQDDRDGNPNRNKVVLSLFDLTGAWSQPWEDAGYQVFRFDIQDDPVGGDVNNFSTEFFNDWWGSFDGMDIYAILAACPCTDFASSGARHFAAKDADGRTHSSVELVHQTLATIEYFKPAVWAVENPVGRIESLTGLPPWRMSFDPNHLGDPYTKKTLLWGRFNGDLPIAPVEPTEGSKMHTQYGGKSQKTKNARSATPEGFAYGFFMANNASDHPVMAIANKYDRLDRYQIKKALDAGLTEEEISEIVDDHYYMDLDDEAAEDALHEAVIERNRKTAKEDVGGLKQIAARAQRERETNAKIFRKYGGLQGAREGDPRYRIILTKAVSGDAKYRVTTLFNNEPMGHRDYKYLGDEPDASPVNGALYEFAGYYHLDHDYAPNPELDQGFMLGDAVTLTKRAGKRQQRGIINNIITASDGRRRALVNWPDGEMKGDEGEAPYKPEGGVVQYVDLDKLKKLAEQPPTETVDAAAHEAATSPKNELPAPSDAQKEAGNYKKGHVTVGGLDISIENPAGSKRRPEWPTMKAHYGYIRGTVGKDKDHVDVFVKPMTPESWDGTVFVVDQKKAGNGHFDEHKVMIGYPDLAAAEKAYRNSYTAGWDGIRAITPTPFAEFKTWLESGDTTKPYAERNGEPPAAEAAPTPELNKRHTIDTASVMTPAGALKASATSSRAPSSLWFYQGDLGRLAFQASVTINGQPDAGADDAREMLKQIKAAQAAGWSRRNVRAGRLGTVWIFERGKELLTRAGMKAFGDSTFSRPELPPSVAGYEGLARRQIAFASAFSSWLNSLDGDQQSNRGVMSRKMGETSVGEWARLEDEKGGLRLWYVAPDGKNEINVGVLGDWDDLRRYIHALADVAPEAANATDLYPVMAKAATAAGVRFSQNEPQPAKPVAPEPKKAAPAATDDKQPLLTQHLEIMRAVRDGKATPEQYKAGFRAILDQPDAVKAQLNLDSKDAILKALGPYFTNRHKADKKAEIVEAAYKALLAEYALGKSYGPNSYVLSPGAIQKHEQDRRNALIELVDSQNEETLAAYAAEVKQAREENAASRAKAMEAIENPKTLDDFRSFMSFHLRNGKSESEARLSLTPEQRTRYDELWAESTREAREARKREAKTQVRAAGQSVAGGIVETKHTRDGYDLFVVRLEERVSAEDYRTLLSSAKRLGGWYSKFRGNGAVPGWQFKTRESAEAFQKLAGGDTAAAEEVVSARRDAFEDDRSQTAVQRLNEMADRLEERAEESLGRDRKQNTDRRARMAASAEAAAQQELALAKTMRNLARSIEAGEAKFLDAVRQKAQVEMLATLLRNAKDAELRQKYPAYIDYERHRGEPATEETVDFATFPSFTAFRSDLATLGRQLLEVEGTKAMGQSLMKVADDVTDAYIEFAKANFHKVATFARGDQLAKFERREDAERAIIRSGFRGKAIVLPLKRGENVIVLSPSESINRGIWQGDGDKRITLKREFGMELVEKLGRVNRRKNRVTVPYQFEAAHDRLKSLSRLGIETPAEFRSALREFVRLRELPAAPDKVKELERSMIGRQNDGLDFFPTPQSIADEMIEAAELAPGMRVLEPSAGWGHIAERIREAGIDPDVIEVSSKRRELLEAKGFRLVGSDFMDLKGRSGFTYGDIFRAPDGTVGVMRSSGGMGSNRVGLDPLDADGNPDRRRFQWHDFDDLTPVKRKDDPLGAVVPRSDLTALEESRDFVRGDVLSSVRQAIRWYDRGDYAGAAELINRATRQAEFNPAALDRFGDIEMRLNAAAEGQYDRILMNPPFSDGRDIAHVRHAFDLLKPGGRLVAIMGEGAFFQSNKRAEEFRAWLDEVGGTEEKLPAGAFTDPSLPVTTGVNARMVVIDRPPIDSGTQYSNPESPASAGLSVSEVENEIGAAVLGVSDAVGLRLNVVASNAELPADVRRDLKAGQRPHGVLTAGNEVYIVAGNMRTLRAARAAFAHEVIGHLGINQVVEDWDAVRQRIRWLVKSGNRRAKEIHADLNARYPGADADTYAREFIALASERAHDGPVAQLLTRVRAAIRRFLSKIGLRQAFQGWEIDVWLSDSRRYLRTGKSRQAAPPSPMYSMTDERERFRWDVEQTANGPVFQNDDLALFPDETHAPAGWGGANGYIVLDQETGQKIAEMVVSLDGDRVSEIHWIRATKERNGAGMRAVRSILANSNNPVRVTSILDTARAFWDKMGAHDYDEASNAFLDWGTYAPPAGNGRVVQGAAEETGAGRGEADDGSAEGEESGEVRPPQYSNPSERFDQKAKDWLADHLKSNKRVSWWSRTVGTMYHLAERVPQFKAVFDAGQDFLSDVSRIAVEAEGLAPGLFRQMTTVEKAFKTGTASAKDVAAISKAVYAGTLSDMKVYGDEELRDQFHLTPAQIGLYRQAMTTAHKSLDDLTLSSIYRMAATIKIPPSALRAAREQSEDTEGFLSLIYAEFLKPARDSLNERVEEIEADIDELEAAERLNEGDDEALENIRNEMESARAELAEVTKERDALSSAIAEMYKAKARMEQLKGEGYFPLMRFGKYTVEMIGHEINEETGQPDRYFGMFESEAEANTMARLMQVEYPRADITTGIASQDDWRLFPGLTPDVVESFARLTGQGENELFKDYIRLAVSNRSAMKRFLNRKGVPGFSTDVNRTLATFVLSNARLASSHYHMGDMRKAVDAIPKQMGDVKDMATRLVLYLTNPQEEWAGLRGFMFFHFLGGSIASALTNLTQVPMVTMPWLSQYGAGAAARALKWARPGAAPSNDAHKEALKRAEDEGIVSPQEVYNLMATARGGSLGAGKVLSSRPVQTALYVWGSLFSAAEQFNRRVTFNSAFELAQKRRERDPYAFAVRAVEQTQFVYNRGNRPVWGRGIGAPLFTFKQFSISYLELLKRMPTKQKLLMVALLVLAAGLEGLPFEEDLEDIIDTIAQWNGYAWSTRAELETWAEKHLGRSIGPLMTRGVSGIGIPIDVQARLGLGNLIPGTALGKPSSLDPGKEALEVLGAPGGVLKSLGYAGQSAARGDWYGAIWSAAPRAVQNVMKGVQMWQEGEYLDPQQRLVTETTRGDAVAKAIGFQPTTVSDVQRGQRQVDAIVQLHKVTEDGIADTWARGIVFKKPEMVAEARERLKKWNADNPGHRIVIAPRQITLRVKTLRLTQRERYLKTVPKELRQQAAEQYN